MKENYIQTVSYLPDPPMDLVDDIDIIPSIRENHHFDTSYSHIYASYTTSQELEDYYQQFFDYDIACRYQVINAALRAHVDDGLENQWKYNYLFTAGGNVETSFWSDVQQPGGFEYPGTGPELLHTEVCEENQWYKLNVACPHSISQPSSTRFSLVIRRK